MLGTSFNVDAYAGNGRHVTTLVTGRIGYAASAGADEVVLAEQAQRNAAAIGNAAELHIFEGGAHSFTEYSDEAGALLSDWLGKCLKCGAC